MGRFITKFILAFFSISCAAPALSQEFAWSFRGPLPNYDACVKWLETAEPSETTWHDNYLCHNTGFEIRWSSDGPINGLRCTHILEAADPHTWYDNYLCTEPNAPFALSWSSAGAIAERECLRILEPSDPATWDDNYLCVSSATTLAPSLSKQLLTDVPRGAVGVAFRDRTITNPLMGTRYTVTLDGFYLREQQDRREDLYLMIEVADGSGGSVQHVTKTYDGLDEDQRYWAKHKVYDADPRGDLIVHAFLFDQKGSGQKKLATFIKWSTKPLGLDASLVGESLAFALGLFDPGDDYYGYKNFRLGGAGAFPAKSELITLTFKGTNGSREYDIDVFFKVENADLPPPPERGEVCSGGYVCSEVLDQGNNICWAGKCRPPGTFRP